MYYDELIQIPLGSIQQWVYIRGMKKDSPVLLFLHGGPGFPGIALSSAYQKPLEEDYVVIQWDQRYAGKTYGHSIDGQKLTIALFLSDLFLLVDYIADRFGKEKIYLIGHSWGSLLGMMAIAQAPHRFISYIGIGQFVNLQKNSELSYQYCYKKAREQNNNALIDSVEKLGVADDCAKWDMEHQLVTMLGGSLYKRTDLMPVAKRFFSTELYTEDEKRNIPGAMVDSCIALYDEMKTHNLTIEIPCVDVPILFLSGKHDYFSASALVREYFDVLISPQKRLVLFNESAHFPFVEEPDKFISTVRDWFT